MMMIVLLMKVCIESSRDNSFDFFPFLLGLLRRVFSYNKNNNNITYFHYLSTGHKALIGEGSSARQVQLR